jgi:mono/diheme cytochrome c family protein
VTEAKSSHRSRFTIAIAVVAAVVIPAVLTVLFWRTTPTVGGWSDPKPPAAKPSPKEVAAEITQGAGLYKLHCRSCHGASLEGGRLGPPLRKSHWNMATDAALLTKVIGEGRGKLMPGFNSRLTAEQIEELARFLQRENGIR